MFYSVHFLRGVAALAVMMAHAARPVGYEVAFGAAGVDLFFVISGFVIGVSTRSSDTVPAFYLKRFIRVIPILWVAVLCYAAFRFWAWSEWPSAETWFRSLVMLPGVSGNLIYWPAWTIQYELGFYVVFGVMLGSFRGRHLIACGVFVLVLAVVQVPIPGRGTHFETVWGLEFAFGLGIALLAQHTRGPDRVTGAMCVCAALAIFIINFFPTGHERVLTWGVPAALLMVGLLAFENASLFRARWVTLAGDASYSLYLFHITVIEFISEIGNIHGAPLRNHPLVWFPILCIACIVAAVIVHVLVEKPLTRWLRSVASSQTTRAIGGQSRGSPVEG